MVKNSAYSVARSARNVVLNPLFVGWLNDDPQSCLIRAVEFDSLFWIKRAINAGANVESTYLSNDSIMKLLHYAARWGTLMHH